MSGRTWQTVLKEIDYPEDAVVLDFETYFSDDLGFSCQDTVEYIEDERFEFTGLGVWWLREEKPFFVDGSDVEQFIREFIEPDNNTIIVQNHKFENSIFKRKFGFLPMYPIDVKDLASHVESRGSKKLADIAPKYGLEDKGTDLTLVKGMRWPDIVEADLVDEFRGYTVQDAKLEGELFMKLAPMVTNPELEFFIMRHTQMLYQRPIIRVSRPKAMKVLQRLKANRDDPIPEGMTLDDVSKDARFVEALIELVGVDGVPKKFGKRPSKRIKELFGTDAEIPAIAKDDEGMRQLLSSSDPKVKQLAEARLAVKSWPLHIKRVERIMKRCKDWGGIMGVPLNYYGGHTGRWSGGDGINLQNIPNILQDLKEAMLPLKGQAFFTADSCQIEARGVAWLAGQLDLLQAFADNADPYSQFASRMFDAKVRKPRKTDPKPVRDRFGLRRDVGKVAVLGCGYGMGPDRCYEQMSEDDDMYQKIVDGEITPETAEKLVSLYRKMYPLIPKLWEKMEDAMKFVIKYPNEVATVNGKIKFYADPEHRSLIYMQLPSGRCLRYQNCALSKGKIKWRYGKLWGGSLVENAVQAFCRDIIAEQILELEKHHMWVVMHIHDSITIMDSSSDPHAVEARLNNLIFYMRQSPAWCKDLPLDAEGGVYEYFK